MANNDRVLKLEEVRRNYSFYQEALPTIEVSKHGKYALLRHKTLVEFYDSITDAHLEAQKLYADGIYSIQKVAQAPLELGFFSYAHDQRTA